METVTDFIFWRGGLPNHCCCYVASVVSDSVWPHRWQPTRLPRPWDSPGKNTGVGCHFLLQCMKVESEREVAQSCPTPSAHGLQPTRLLRPWDFPGKSAGVGCHCLLCIFSLLYPLLTYRVFQCHSDLSLVFFLKFLAGLAIGITKDELPIRWKELRTLRTLVYPTVWEANGGRRGGGYEKQESNIWKKNSE